LILKIFKDFVHGRVGWRWVLRVTARFNLHTAIGIAFSGPFPGNGEAVSKYFLAAQAAKKYFETASRRF
jgi:hypothetical protein